MLESMADHLGQPVNMDLPSGFILYQALPKRHGHDSPENGVCAGFPGGDVSNHDIRGGRPAFIGYLLVLCVWCPVPHPDCQGSLKKRRLRTDQLCPCLLIIGLWEVPTIQKGEGPESSNSNDLATLHLSIVDEGHCTGFRWRVRGQRLQHGLHEHHAIRVSECSMRRRSSIVVLGGRSMRF